MNKVSINANNNHPLFTHPVLLLKDDNKKYLIISDLHIGFEEKLRALGINIVIRIKEMQQELNFLINQTTRSF